ncbi:DUF916 and DUF3324 domain-containing protein [Enterococcus dongliensis]|uniref:DUF916 and DUF3324 domain-containing protein n=1 Tax=Enterococcus dongliensis TaxID=2559925 RepID=UPI00288F6E3D|nr:DUF916 and DUF3324 domain-containing protein [Enterococcus dongliensis]MDT2604598.1 DUF916 and DUF3324 domain-containing protein [Enterococcus dongliensis]MDT2645863.1 DUF916 and DUF3324 domain-containing protein [Enterococcus dongliensis]MDT2672310.1 DUF916 and DUF3324 domain-containing protein [Enterococcus dongliensis]MDT2712084.1 DUF916 and DUF3324 domain-containing protein [Enterococcus dongliensis]
MKNTKFIVSIVSCLLLAFVGRVVFADETSADGYSVSANIPDFQTDTNVSYFDLLLEPKEQKEISIHLVNNSKETATFIADVNNAATNSNGVIDYSKTNFEKDRSAKYELNKLVTPKTQEITLASGEAKDVAFQLKMPDENFKGIILGGIHVEKKDAASKKLEGTGIRNKYAYVIGVKLQNSMDKIDPDLKMLTVKPGLQNSYTTIFAKLQNPTATIMNKLAVNAKITKKGSKEVLYETKSNSLSVAPNTNFNYPIDLKKQKIQPGEYTVTIDATKTETGQKWHLAKNFTIQSDAVKKINKEAIIKKEPINYLPYMIVVGIVLVVVILFLSYKLMRQQNKGR